MARTGLLRHQLSQTRAPSERLQALARGRASRSPIPAEAVAAFLDRKGADAIELRFMGLLARSEPNGLESLALFVRDMLTRNAPLPQRNEGARAIARYRFAAFVQRVDRQLASGRRTFLAEDER